MLDVNLAPISKIAFIDIWRKDFSTYGIHTSSAFAKFDGCLLFMNMLLKESRSAERAKREYRRELHLKHQMSGWNEYYYHKEMSTRTPSLYLSFIHDAIDHAKTYVPRLSNKLKSLMRHVTPLPVKMVEIIIHGHEPNIVAHVTVTDVIQARWRSNEEAELQDGFWSIIDYGTCHQVRSQTSTDPNNSMGNKRRDVEEELQARDEIFVGEAAARSLATFVPIIDITVDLMLLLQSSDDFEC
ncbi:hypothetical protein R1sor_005148 [Riccia sorocarpa]|uniref:Uncharacterized protein n=1 Tax=Riccia sorocarpa TaxID=122646 RepID=A0ABD3HM71_9MARC